MNPPLPRRPSSAAQALADACRLYQKCKDGPWYADLRPFRAWGGKQVALVPEGQRLATTRRGLATKLYSAHLETFIAKMERGEASPSTPASAPPRLGPYGAEHLRKKRQAGRAKDGTIQNDEKCLRRLLRWFGNCRLTEITTTRLDAYVDYRLQQPGSKAGTTLSNATVRNELHTLSNLLSRAKANGHVAENVVELMHEKPAPPPAREVFLERDAAAHLLDVAHEMDVEARAARCIVALRERASVYRNAGELEKAQALEVEASSLYLTAGLAHVHRARQPIMEALFGLMLYTGLRHNEALGLSVRDVDFAQRKVHVRKNGSRSLKSNSSTRSVMMWPGLEAILRRYLTEEDLTTGLLFPGRNVKGEVSKRISVGKQLSRAAKRAGIAHLSPHALRHTYTTMSLLTSITLEDGSRVQRDTWTVARQLGHKSDVQVRTVYDHISERTPFMDFLDYEAVRLYPSTARRNPAVNDCTLPDHLGGASAVAAEGAAVNAKER